MDKTFLAFVVSLMSVCFVLADNVFQSEREIPCVRDCDVLVVGGGGAAVAAAIAAKTNGASVFLVAPRNYLGDDIAGTRELWPEIVSEFDSVDLVKEVFPIITPFSYAASVTPNPSHADPGNTRLNDGVQYDATKHSVQYDSDVEITCTFPGAGTLLSFDLYYYKRLTSRPFDTVVTSVQYSLDGNIWQSANIDVDVQYLLASGDIDFCVANVAFPGGIRAAYLKISCDIAPDCERQLLDEIIFEADPDDRVPDSFSQQTPLIVKQSLQKALERENIPFLGSSHVTDVILDANDKLSGVVIANRNGRQAVRARVVIDATADSLPAQLAGAVKRSFISGDYSFSRVVFADETNAPLSSAVLSVSEIPSVSFNNITVSGVDAPVGMPSTINAKAFRCVFTTNLVSGSALELLEVEQTMRDLTWVKTCVDQADSLTWIPPDTIVGVASETAVLWPGVEALDMDAFRPDGVDNLYVLSLRADVPRSLATDMSNPARMMAVGQRVGSAAAATALARPVPHSLVIPGDSSAVPSSFDLREFLTGLPPAYVNSNGFIVAEATALPVVANCEVLVVGAGTSGAPAAIAAGRAGADTIVIDYLYNMGGVQTDGRIGLYYHGNACGFTTNDVDPGVQSTGAVLATAKSEWYRRACREAGVRILYGTMAVGAVVEGTTLRGIVIVLPDGQRAVISANTVVDASGNALIAAFAGEETEFIKSDEVAVQGAGHARHLMGNSYANSDIGFVDERAVCDVFFFARRAYASMSTAATWDAGQNPTSRERRRLVGAVTVSPLDILNNRTWPDTIVRASSDFDSHGFTVHDIFFINAPSRDEISANLPYRALLPKTLDGLLVTGLGISAHRDAMPILRMQRDVQNQGYAAGYAAALAVQSAVTPRNVDITSLQSHLVAKGIITSADANGVDSFPLGSSAIQTAVNDLADNYASLHAVLTDVPIALPMLRSAYENSSDPSVKLIYAHVLGMLYDDTGVDTLVNAVSSTDWDIGWNYTGMGQYGASVSLMDSYIIALGRTGHFSGIQPVVTKIRRLSGSSSFSHVRSVCLACENFASGSVIPALSDLLSMVEGYAFTNALVAPIIPGFSNTHGDSERNLSLKEIYVARALYRLGDDFDLNATRVLESYAVDPREVYAAHARQVLDEGMLVVGSDGVWVATGAIAEWNDPANWQDGVIAQGAGSIAWFTNSVAGGNQSISLNSMMLNVGSMVFADSDRVLQNGVVDLINDQPLIDVKEGAAVRFDADIIAGLPVEKSGLGTLEFAGTVTIGGVELRRGSLLLTDPDAAFYDAYSADPNGAIASAITLNVLRSDFQVNQSVMLTALGAFDSYADGFHSFKKVSVYRHGISAPIATLAFAPNENYELSGGHRYRRLPQPLMLLPGTYSIVTYGFDDNDRYIIGGQDGADDMVGTLNDADGALTFLSNGYGSYNHDRTNPTLPAGSSSEYPLTAGSLRFGTDVAEKTISGPVFVASDALLDVAAVSMTFADGLYAGDEGMGIVSNASAAYPVSLTLGIVDQGTTNLLSGAAIANRADGPLTLVKDGRGTLIFNGDLAFDGGLSVNLGLLEVDSPAALSGGDLSFGTGGRLFIKQGGTLDKVIYVPSQSGANNQSTRLELAGGETLTLTSALIAARVYDFNGFVLQPHSVSSGLTTFVLDGCYCNYFDFYLYGDVPEGTGMTKYEVRSLTGNLRKLAAGDATVSGSQISFEQGCDFSTGWFDVCGSNAVVTINDGARVRVDNQLRFNNGNGSQLVLNNGFLDVMRFGVENTANQHLSLQPLLFNGAWLTALGDNVNFFNLSYESAAPLICDGGALFNSAGYDVAIKGKGFAQAPNSTGAFVKDGAGTLRIATPMEYSGLTIVSNGVLTLDFALWLGDGSPASNLLPPANTVLCSGGILAVNGAADTNGEFQQKQRLKHISNTDGTAATLDVNQAVLEVNELKGEFIKTGDGTLMISCDDDGNADINGTLTVSDGTLDIRSPSFELPVEIPYTSFETDPLLPSNPINAKDKRGTAATGCPGWTFSAKAGYQRNHSYFSSSPESYAPDGIQTAFIMENNWMSTAFDVISNGFYTLKFQYCPRSFSSRWYTNHIIRVTLNGVLKDEIIVAHTGFIERVVELGLLAPGSYTLNFTGDNSLASDSTSMIDLVAVSGATPLGEFNEISSAKLHLRVDAPGRIALNYNGLVSIDSLTIDGQPFEGVYINESSHPDLVTGIGTLRVVPSGLLIIVR